ncbi:MAG: ATP-binding cassette subfamily B multidrug efflux pump [Myxococcota bacterium]|jgi:ATP-binding cassette subfamily B multidrug efflux pump
MSQPPSDFALIWRWMVFAWRDNLGALAVILILSLGNTVLVIAFPWLWQYLIDTLQTDASAPRLQELATWMVIVGVSQAALYVVLQGTRSVVNARISLQARRRIFDHLTALPPSFYRRWQSGDLVTRLSDDAGNKIAWFLCSGVFRTFEASLIVIGCLAVMASIDPWMTAQVILPLPLLIAAQAGAQGALGRRYKAVQESISRINSALTTTFSGIRIVQACHLQAPARRRFRAAAEEQRTAEVSVAVVQKSVFLMYGYGWQLAIVALLVAGGGSVIRGDISLGQFVSFEGFVMTLVWPMFDVGMFVSKYKQTSVALTRLQEILDVPAARSPQTPAPPSADLAVQGVSVVAEDGTVLLSDIDLHVPAGTSLAIVGQIGSGKTILMELLAGQRPPSSGTVTLGGQPQTPPRSPAVLGMIGHVPQDAILVSASLAENLLLGRDADEAAVTNALTLSRLAGDLPALSDGLATRVGERGVTLSGGQQQRLAIARALVDRPAILLLDDATAALDADTEAAFWAGVAGSLPGVSVVMVTHRAATIQRADAVVVLDGGRIVQRGSHESLLAEGGEYARIYGRLEAAAVLV